jgi:predicted nucleic acid-binding protein
MKNGKPVYLWDTSILLKWINGEAEPEDTVAGIADVVAKIDKGKCFLVFSQITRVEAFSNKAGMSIREKVEAAFQRENVVVVDVDSRIARKAAEIREHCQGLDPSRKVKTPDAIQIATAIVHDADELHIQDGPIENLSDEMKKKYGLKVCPPPPPHQGRLDLPA